MSDADRFGAALRQARLAAALSQEALAERAGLSTRGISDLERGARRVPRAETARMLADALGLAGGDRVEFLAVATRPAVSTANLPTALPIPLDTLVGREAEIAALGTLLGERRTRLVTLTGPGGVGKTRLALAAAETLKPAFSDGAWLVGLAAVADPSLVPVAVAQALNVRESGDEPLWARITGFLRGKRLLLVLDNLEHVVGVAPFVGELLGACPDLVVLATSRVRLRLAGEQEFPVAPLAVSSADGDDAPAIRLFAERARAVRPDFALGPENATAVSAVCRRLDGLPLAIELAAARVKVLPPRALLARLERTLPLLTGGNRDLPARQRTVRDAVAWSYDLLSPAEQALFRMVSVFVGGFTLAAAEAVARVGRPAPGTDQRATPGARTPEPEVRNRASDTLDVLDGVSSLAEHSLLREEDGPDGEPRFLLLETVREFGLERLEAARETATVHDAHAAWALAFAEAADPVDVAAWQPERIAVVAAEHANLTAALGWLLECGRGEEAQRLAGHSARSGGSAANLPRAKGYSAGRWLLQPPRAGGAPWPSLARAACATQRATAPGVRRCWRRAKRLPCASETSRWSHLRGFTAASAPTSEATSRPPARTTKRAFHWRGGRASRF